MSGRHENLTHLSQPVAEFTQAITALLGSAGLPLRDDGVHRMLTNKRYMVTRSHESDEPHIASPALTPRVRRGRGDKNAIAEMSKNRCQQGVFIASE